MSEPDERFWSREWSFRSENRQVKQAASPAKPTTTITALTPKQKPAPAMDASKPSAKPTGSFSFNVPSNDFTFSAPSASGSSFNVPSNDSTFSAPSASGSTFKLPEAPASAVRKKVSFSDFLAQAHEEEAREEKEAEEEASKNTTPKMTEPRARAARHKGQLNFGPELASLLYGFGDDVNPLPETVRVLDDIVSDFIIETCHGAAQAAQISGRQKIKVDDFKFAIRKNEEMLGRVQELLGMDRELKEARKQFDTGEGKVGLERGGKKKDKKGEDAE